MPALPGCQHHIKRGFLAEVGVRRVDLLAMAALQLIVGLVRGGFELVVEMKQVLALEVLAMLSADWELNHPFCFGMQHAQFYLFAFFVLFIPPSLDKVNAALHIRVILYDPCLTLGLDHYHHVEGHSRLQDRLQFQLNPFPHL